MLYEQALRMFPSAAPAWLIPLTTEPAAFGIDTPIELASFLAQIGHESRGMTKFDENLDYRAERLVQVWPSRFYVPTAERPRDGAKRDARQFAHNPRLLAEAVYSGRNGNGPEGSGDGWNFRGGGPAQLTGRKNYERVAKEIGHDILASPNDVRTVPVVGVRSACAFWKLNGFDRMDDDDGILEETRALNGGTVGLAEREKLFAEFKKILGVA